MNSWQVVDGQNLNFAISPKQIFEALSLARSQSVSIAFPPEPSERFISPQKERESAARADTSAAKERAVSQMRVLVGAIARCPEVFTDPLLKGAANRYEGQPNILEWDVQPSESVRHPFEGFVRFDVPQRLEETVKGRQSHELDQAYHEFVDDITDYEGKTDRSISLAALHYRYEFELGPDVSPELTKATIFDRVNKEFRIYEPQPTSCWDKIANSPGSISTQ